MGEGALHRVDRDPLKVVERPAEGIGTLGELARHLGVAHQTVVAEKRYSKPQSPCSRAGFWRSTAELPDGAA